MTVNTPHRRGAAHVGAFDRVANISIKETPTAKTVASNIRVVVRVRPENKSELDGNYSNVVRVLDERLLIFDPKEEEAPEFYHGRRRSTRDFSKKKKRDMRFAFDYVFDMDCVNLDVYENTTKCVLDGLLDGFNCSVFAYGATGAGKTFTMKGTLDQPGVMFLTMMDLYQRIDQLKEEKTCDVAISYLEVYNEQIRDLLNPGDYLPIREDPNNGAVVSGLSLHKPKDAEQLLHMLEFGNKNRTQHPTDANAESSRSHGVFQVFVRQKERTANVSADVSVAKMSLIDLAGSERATVTKNCGVRFREGANINKSLLALGNCINALAEGKSKGYVPYRNSKLTRLLKDSLGGNCRTVMIAAVSPSAMSYEDTYNTLKYADRAKNIKANLKKNVVSVDYHISHYAKLIEDLRVEVEQYKDKLRSYEQGSMSTSVGRPSFSQDTEIFRLQDVMFSVFRDRMNIRKEIMEMEGSDRDLTYRVYQKERCLNRIALLHSDTAATQKVTSKIQRAIHTSKRRQSNVIRLKTNAQEKMNHNIADLQRVENQMDTLFADGSTSEYLDLSLRTRHLEVELRDTKRQVKYLKKLCRAQQREAITTEKLVTSLLKGFKRQYYILRSYGCATPDIEADFESVQQLLLGDREVSWADQSNLEMTSVSETEDKTTGEVFGGRKDSTEDGFDINQLVDFPVLVCVDTTPKTPHQLGRCQSQMPDNGQSVALTPCTPGSHRKGRFTPRRRSSMPVFDMVASATPKMSGSHQLLTPSAKQPQQGPTSSNLAASPLAIDDDFEILSSGPSSTLKTKSRLNLPTSSTTTNTTTSTHHHSDNVYTNNTLTLSLAAKPAGQVIHRPPPVLTSAGQSVTDHRNQTESDHQKQTSGVHNKEEMVSVIKGSSANYGVTEKESRVNAHHVQCKKGFELNNRGGLHNLNETFTRIDGIEPLVDSPAVTKQQSKLLQGKSCHVNTVNSCDREVEKAGHVIHGNGGNSASLSQCVKNGLLIKPSRSHQSSSNKALNETFTQSEVQVDNSQPTVRNNSANNQSNHNLGSRTYSVSNEPFIKPAYIPLQQAGTMHTSHSSTGVDGSVKNGTETTVSLKSSGQSVALASSCPPGIVMHSVPPSSLTTVTSQRSESGQPSTLSLASSHHGSATVTKSRPDVSANSETGQPNPSDPRSKLLNVTVTKQQPTILQGKENVSPIESNNSQGRPGVVRSMDFSNMPSPAGKLTFAEALKSPAVRSLQQAGVAPFSPRSPLAARENLPQKLFNSESDSLSKKPIYRDHITRDLERMGLPSVRERAQSATRVPMASRPSYMKMTAAASHRKRGNGNNEETNVLSRASRVPREQAKKPGRLVVRSKSFNDKISAPKWNSRF